MGSKVYVYNSVYSNQLPVNNEGWQELSPVVDLPSLVWVPRELAHVVEPHENVGIADVEGLDVLQAKAAVSGNVPKGPKVIKACGYVDISLVYRVFRYKSLGEKPAIWSSKRSMASQS